jgi:hypothetical protein
MNTTAFWNMTPCSLVAVSLKAVILSYSVLEIDGVANNFFIHVNLLSKYKAVYNL